MQVDTGPNGLPTGVITFLFTDIVGSTRIWESEPAAMSEALKQTDAIMARAVTENRGYLLKHRGEGDSTFSVFPLASDGAAAAVAAQRMIAVEQWPTSTPIAVRMAIHSGEAEERSGDYYGRSVNRAARLRGLAEGGQVLCSQATRELIADRISPDTTIELVGLQTLKDLDVPEEVHALRWPGSVDVHIISRPAAPAVDRSVGSLPPAVTRASAARLVGRSDERTILDACIPPSKGTGLRIALVAGEPGVGKSSLCCRVAADAHARGATVLYGRCESDLATPYRPFVEALSHLVRHMTDAQLSAIGNHQLDELANIIPELADRLPSRLHRAKADPDAARYVLINAIQSMLANASQAGPVLFVIEDLHWADAATIQMVRHLAQSGDIAATLLINFRDSDLEPDHPVVALRGDLLREPDVVQLELAGLGHDATLELLDGRLSAGVNSRDAASLAVLAEQLRTETNGNPFFLGELIRGINETNGNISGLPEVPSSVGPVIGRRIDRQGDQARRVLSIAAVIGIEFDAVLLAAVAEVDEDDVLDLVEGAQRARLLTETSTPERFRFAHGLVRTTLYENLSATRRARVHRRVAEALEAGAGESAPQYAPELAHHWSNGHNPSDRGKALHYSRLAGDRAMAQRAPHVALGWYQQALELLDPADPDQTSERCDVLIGIGEAQRQLGVAAYSVTLLDAADLAFELGDGARMAKAALAHNRGMVARAWEVDDAKLAAIDRALDAIGTDDANARPRLLAVKAAELLYDPDHSRRWAIADEALVIARRMGDPATLLFVLNERALPITVPATARERLGFLREAGQLAADEDDLSARFFAAYGRSIAALECVEVDEYLAAVDLMGNVAHELGQPILRWIHMWNDANRLLLMGKLDDADRTGTESLALGLAIEQPDAIDNYGGLALGLRLHQGELRSIVDVIRAAATAQPADIAPRAILAAALVDAEDFEGAHRVVDAELKTNFDALQDHVFLSVSLTLFAEAAIALQYVDAAQILIDRLNPYCDLASAGPVTFLGAYSAQLGGLHAVLGDLETSNRFYARADAVHLRLGFPFFIARTRVAWGEQNGNVEMINSALEIAGRHGFAGVERAAIKALQG